MKKLKKIFCKFLMIINVLALFFINIPVTNAWVIELNHFYSSGAWYSSTNPYYPTYQGECTWFVWGRVYDKLGIYLNIAGWGDAKDWANAARNAGYKVDYTPSADSIVVWSAGTWGHVGYVEKVTGNTMLITEGNYGGAIYRDSELSVTDKREYGVTPQFIHLKEEAKESYKPGGSVQNFGTGFTATIHPKTKTSLALKAGGNTNGSAISLANYSYDKTMNWEFTRQSDGTYNIKNAYSGRSIDVYGAGNINGEAVQVWKDSNGDKNCFFIYNFNGGYRFVPRSSKKDKRAIDIINNNIVSGSKLQLYEAEYATNNAQTFVIRKYANSITLNNTNITLNKGNSYSLKATFSPTDTYYKTLSWKSNDTNVATVDTSGKITAKNAGTTTITATTTNGKKATVTVTVPKPAPNTVEITDVSLNKKNAILKVKENLQLTATINPSNTTQSKNLSWKSSNTKVATVDDNGKVTAVKGGTTTITVTTSNGRTANCIINVENPITAINLDKKQVTMAVGDKQTLKATINPSDTTTSKNIIWRSSKTAVAIIDATGKITAISPGTTVITAITSNGLVATSTVVVNAKASTSTKPNEGTTNNNSQTEGTTNNNSADLSTTIDNNLSTDTSIKSFKIDGKEIDVTDNMEYLTNNDNVSIEVEPNDKNAAYEVVQEPLKDGSNNALVLVTAEDGSVKVYTLDIVKVQEELSNNTNIKVFVNGKEVEFTDGKANIKEGFFTKKVKITYELEDSSSTVKTNINDDLNIGDNKSTFKVVAEDSSQMNYELTITRTSTLLYIIIISGLIGVGLIILIIVLVIKSKKKKKSK